MGGHEKQVGFWYTSKTLSTNHHPMLQISTHAGIVRHISMEWISAQALPITFLCYISLLSTTNHPLRNQTLPRQCQLHFGAMDPLSRSCQSCFMLLCSPQALPITFLSYHALTGQCQSYHSTMLYSGSANYTANHISMLLIPAQIPLLCYRSLIQNLKTEFYTMLPFFTKTLPITCQSRATICSFEKPKALVDYIIQSKEHIIGIYNASWIWET